MADDTICRLSAMIGLGNDELLVRIDPGHGAEILELVDLRSGRQLLARPPFPAERGLVGDLPDEDTWCRGYRGGWQLVTPNAGNACSVGGRAYGFHGAASTEPWQVVESHRTSCLLTWRDQMLQINRQMTVSGEELRVETEWSPIDEDAAYVAVEHLAVGTELLVPGVRICLPGGRAFQQSDTEGPVRPPADAPAWPEARLLNAEIALQDAWSCDQIRAHVLTVSELPAGWAELHNRNGQAGLRVEWDLDFFPHLWLWHEARGSDGLWRQMTEILGIEPASVAHGLGLAEAVASGQAYQGERERQSWISVRPVRT